MRILSNIETLICVQKALERLKAFPVDVWRRHVNADLYIQIARIQIGSLSMPQLTIRGRFKKRTWETSYHRDSKIEFCFLARCYDTHLARVRFEFLVYLGAIVAARDIV